VAAAVRVVVVVVVTVELACAVLSTVLSQWVLVAGA
jgi:hypothetical protein